MEKVLLNTIPAIFTGFIVQILIHEIGHLIGGIITGWKFLFIQVYRLVLKRTNKGLKFDVVKDRGFKCILYPESIDAKALLYTMGGCIINLVTGAIGLIILILVPMPPVEWLYMWCFSAFGIGMYIVNGRANIKRVCNDKACNNLIKTDHQTSICHNAQLIVAYHLMKGMTYRNIGDEIICLCPEVASNDIEAYQAVLEFYYYLDVGNHLKMGRALNKIRNRDNISEEVADIIEMEFLYVRLLLAIKLNIEKTDSNKASNIVFNLNDIEKCIKDHENKGDIHSLRIKAVFKAYRKYMTGAVSEAVEILDKAIKLVERSSYVYEGEKKFSIRQLSYIKKCLNAA